MKLSPQQKQILEALARGESKKMIAATMGCSRENIEHIIRRVRKKVNCSNAAHLIAFCTHHNYIDPFGQGSQKDTVLVEGE